MIFTGNYTRSISRQNQQCAIGAQFSLSPNDLFSFGMSGSGNFLVNISGNKIFDNDGNYIFGGQSGDNVFIKVYRDSHGILNYVNGDLKSFNSLSTQYYDYLTLNTSSSKTAALYVSGVEPSLTFTSLNVFNTNVDVMTGLLLNSTPSKLYRILSGEVSRNTPSNVFLSGWTLGDISNSGFLYLGVEDENFEVTGNADLVLYTNFGELRINVDLDTLAVNAFDYFTLWPSGEVFFAPNTAKRYFTEGFYNTGNRNLAATLEYVSGGAAYPEVVLYSGIGSGYLYGLISGTGNATGLISGYTDDVFYLSGITGFKTVTGDFSGTFTGSGTGLYNGNLYTGLITSGYALTLVSGDSGQWLSKVGTGLVSFSAHSLSGTGWYEEFIIDSESWLGDYERTEVSGLFNNNAQYYTRTNFALGSGDHVEVYFESELGGIFNSGNLSGMSGADYVYTGILSGIPDNTNVSGVFQVFAFPAFSLVGGETLYNFGLKFPIYQYQNVTVTGTGVFPTHTFSSLFDESFLSGIQSGRLESTGQINFTDIWRFSTGVDINHLLDFHYYNYYNSTKYINTGYLSPLSRGEIQNQTIEVFYDGTQTSGVNIARLFVSDGFTSVDLLISGTGQIL